MEDVEFYELRLEVLCSMTLSGSLLGKLGRFFRYWHYRVYSSMCFIRTPNNVRRPCLMSKACKMVRSARRLRYLQGLLGDKAM